MGLGDCGVIEKRIAKLLVPPSSFSPTRATGHGSKTEKKRMRWQGGREGGKGLTVNGRLVSSGFFQSRSVLLHLRTLQGGRRLVAWCFKSLSERGKVRVAQKGGSGRVLGT